MLNRRHAAEIVALSSMLGGWGQPVYVHYERIPSSVNASAVQTSSNSGAGTGAGTGSGDLKNASTIACTSSDQGIDISGSKSIESSESNKSSKDTTVPLTAPITLLTAWGNAGTWHEHTQWECVRT